MTDYNRKQLDYNRSLFLSLFCKPCVIIFVIVYQFFLLSIFTSLNFLNSG